MIGAKGFCENIKRFLVANLGVFKLGLHVEKHSQVVDKHSYVWVLCSKIGFVDFDSPFDDGLRHCKFVLLKENFAQKLKRNRQAGIAVGELFCFHQGCV